MPNYLLEHYEILGLDDDATHQEVIKRHEELIKCKQDDPSAEISIDQINLAKKRLTKLLRPVAPEELVLVFDLDLTITKLTSIDAKYLNNCDNTTILNNIRNPNEFKKLVLTAIGKGHRVTIATFNEHCVTYQNKKIYLAQRIFLALFSEEIVSQIWIAAKNNNSDKDKVFHIKQIKQIYNASLSQMVMIDDDIQVIKVINRTFNTKLLTFEMTHYEKNEDFKHLTLIHSLTFALSDKSFLKKIPMIIDASDRYLNICEAKTNDARKVLELIKKYILQNFDFIHPRIMITGLISLIDNHQISVINTLIEYESLKLALCTDDTVLILIDSIIKYKAISNPPTNDSNINILITSIISAHNQYITKYNLENAVVIPLTKILQLITLLQSNELAESYFTSLQSDKVVKLFGILLVQSHWKLATILLKIHAATIQKYFTQENCQTHLQQCYYRFPGRTKPLTTDQQIVGKQLLTLLRKCLEQLNLVPQNEMWWSHYLALEITFGDQENFTRALKIIEFTPAAPSIKNHIFIGILSRTVMPVSCENNSALLKQWLESLLTKDIDLKNNDTHNQSFMNNILLFGNSDIFDLLNKHLVLPTININHITFCINNQSYALALYLFKLLDISSITERDILKLNEIQHLSIDLIEKIHDIAKKNGMPLPALKDQPLLLNAIEKGNINRVKNILTRNKVVIDEDIILYAINHLHNEILELLILSTTMQIDYHKILMYICSINMNPSINLFDSLNKTTRCDLLRTVLLHGHITDLDIKDSSGNTLLHQVIKLYDADSVELLLRLGCNLLMIDAQNHTAVTFAQQLYNTVDFDDDEDNLAEDEKEDYFRGEIADLNNSQITTTNLDYRDKIITILTKTENKYKSNSARSEPMVQLYHLVRCNQLSNTLQFLATNPILKVMLSDKENPIGIDLLNIILFETQNSLMLKHLLSLGISAQLSEPSMGRILYQIMRSMYYSTDSINPISFELLDILCSYLFKNNTSKKIFHDIALLRMFIPISTQDNHLLGSGFNLLDKFISAFGVELFYLPLLTMNITEEERLSLEKIRELYPQQKNSEPTLTKSMTLQTLLPSTAETKSTILPTTSTIKTTTFIELGDISNSEKITCFSSLYTKQNEDKNDSKKRKEIYSNETVTNIFEVPPTSKLKINK